VAECREGSGEAWSALVDKYKKYVYAIICRYGVQDEEAADLFQSVWLDAFNDLGKLSQPDSVRPWLASITSHKCFHWKRQRYRRQGMEVAEAEAPNASVPVAPDFVAQLERDQLIREALDRLPARCHRLIRLLFFASPPVPYAVAARSLGLATGSIGFIRGRCLEKLRKALESLGG
jgi:RNA polymerase sigma factor (sigma-70 family)